MDLHEYKSLMNKPTWSWDDFYAIKDFEHSNIDTMDIANAYMSVSESVDFTTKLDLPEYFWVEISDLDEATIHPDNSKNRKKANKVTIHPDVKKHPDYEKHHAAIHALRHHLENHGTSKVESHSGVSQNEKHHHPRFNKDDGKHNVHGVGKISANFNQPNTKSPRKISKDRNKPDHKAEEGAKKARSHHAHLGDGPTSKTLVHFSRVKNSKSHSHYEIHDIHDHKKSENNPSINDVKRKRFSESNELYAKVIENLRKRLL